MSGTVPIYLDHNATTPLHPEALECMLPYLTHLTGNPSSLHASGQEARAGVDSARQQVANLLGCAAGEVHFTSGGTEADNWAIKGLAADAGRPGRIVISTIEHHAVWQSCEFLRARSGYEVVYVPVGEDGVVRVDRLIEALDSGDTPLFVSIMHANNETGVLQPVAQIGKAVRARGIPFHVDAVQSFGKIPVSVLDLDADLVSVSAHKINGPKGVGALYVRATTSIEPQSHGGGHEGGLRAGTENVAGIVGFGAAAEIRIRDMAADEKHLQTMRDRFERNITAEVEGIIVNGGVGHRLPNTSNLTIHGVEAESIIVGLDLQGIAVSSGSACSSGSSKPSHVLIAMGLEPRQALSSVRFSFGLGNTIQDIDRVCRVLPSLAIRLRELSTVD